MHNKWYLNKLKKNQELKIWLCFVLFEAMCIALLVNRKVVVWPGVYKFMIICLKSYLVNMAALAKDICQIWTCTPLLRDQPRYFEIFQERSLWFCHCDNCFSISARSHHSSASSGLLLNLSWRYQTLILQIYLFQNTF